MTVSNTTPKETKNGNDSATVFSFAFVINKSEDMSVTLTDDLGVETVITEGTGEDNFSVNVSSYPNSGSITYPASGSGVLPSGWMITLARVVVVDQDTALQNQGAYKPKQVESAFDYGCMISLQQQEQIDRSIKAPISTSSSIDFTLPSPLAGRTLGAWNDDGDGIDIGPTVTEISSAQSAAESALISADNAKESEDNASASANASAASAALSQQYAESIAQWEVEKVDSDLIIPSTKNGTIWVVDASLGDVTLTVPSIAAVGEPFTSRVKKVDSSVNKVITIPSGSDTIDGGLSFVLDTEGQGIQLDADIDSTPDDWVSSEFGPGVSAALEARVTQNEIDIAGLSDLGVNQTWQDVTSNRNIGATYTNLTDSPRVVSVSTTSSLAASNTIILIDGVQQAFVGPNVLGATVNLQTIVPPGSTYGITAVNMSIALWTELK